MPRPYQHNDKWSQRAAAEGFRARSVYKLMELDERLHLLKPGMTVLDLGAAPGSWLQYASKRIGPRGKAIGIDLTAIRPVGSNVSLYQGDITDAAAIDAILEKERLSRVDLLLCDIAPNTSGIKDIDQWRSVELANAAAGIGRRFLRPGGKAVLKIFRGADFDPFLKQLQSEWKGVRTLTVKASRDRSKEVYIVATLSSPQSNG